MLSNYWQPTPKSFRKLGDLLLALIVPTQAAIIAAPNLNPTQKYWYLFICTIGLVIGKFLTNLAKENPTATQSKVVPLSGNGDGDNDADDGGSNPADKPGVP